MNDWLANFNLMKSMNELSQNINTFLDITKGFFNLISQALYYISHPAILAQMIWSGVIGISFWLCLALCFAGIIMYLVGYKKGSAVAKTSVFSFLALQVLNSVL
jgi:hypothetical protein